MEIFVSIGQYDQVIAKIVLVIIMYITEENTHDLEVLVRMFLWFTVEVKDEMIIGSLRPTNESDRLTEGSLENRSLNSFTHKTSAHCKRV